jgi:hypothetical protein
MIVQKTLRNFESRSNIIAFDILQFSRCNEFNHDRAHFEAFHVFFSAIILILLENLFVIVNIAFSSNEAIDKFTTKSMIIV